MTEMTRNFCIWLSLLAFLCTTGCTTYHPDIKSKAWVSGDGKPVQIEKLADRKFRRLNKDPVRWKPPVYRLRSGDLLSVRIDHIETLKFEGLVVDPSGQVSLPMAGRIDAAGLTPVQAGKKIEDTYDMIFPDSITSVSVTRKQPATCAVLGQVGNPGLVDVEGGRKLVDVIADAGGFTYLDRRDALGASDLSRAFVARHETLVPVDFRALFERGDMTQNIKIFESDLVFVPDNTHREVVVLGEVNKAGVIPMGAGSMTILKAIGHAGGLGEFAEFGSVVVLRNINSEAMVRAIDLRDVIEANEDNLELINGDVVYISRDDLLALDLPGIFKSASTSLLLAYGAGGGN